MEILYSLVQTKKTNLTYYYLTLYHMIGLFIKLKPSPIIRQGSVTDPPFSASMMEGLESMYNC